MPIPEISDRQDSLFMLVRSLGKSEKRAFRLYANRLNSNSGSKFLALFDCLDSMETYSQETVLRRCPSVSRTQLPNLKAHLYSQILKSLRMLESSRNARQRVRECVDYAQILYDRCLYGQAVRMLDRAQSLAVEYDEITVLTEISYLRQRVSLTSALNDMSSVSESSLRESEMVFGRISDLYHLNRMAVRLQALHQEVGYARSPRDLDLLNNYFRPRLERYSRMSLGFTERFFFYQAMAWYHYLRHEFSGSYRYAYRWVEMFASNPQMRTVLYDRYLTGMQHFLEGLFLIRRRSLYDRHVERFRTEASELSSISPQAERLVSHILFVAELNRAIMTGSYREGLWHTIGMDSYLRRYAGQISQYERMELSYKIARLHFCDGNYERCMEYLSGIISVKDPKVRRDLQCYARILNLMALYDSGQDSDIDRHIRSTFTFIVKMRDMTQMHQVLFGFFRRLPRIDASEFRHELRHLYDELRPYAASPWERRTFYYIDILSWLESKIWGRSVGSIIRERCEREMQKERTLRRANSSTI